MSRYIIGPNFRLQLNQSPTARLAWEPASGATSYILLPVGTERLQILPAQATSAVDHTGGRLTCYVLVSQLGGNISGISATLCAVPGLALGL